jgi:hypothetical protein
MRIVNVHQVGHSITWGLLINLVSLQKVARVLMVKLTDEWVNLQRLYSAFKLSPDIFCW